MWEDLIWVLPVLWHNNVFELVHISSFMVGIKSFQNASYVDAAWWCLLYTWKFVLTVCLLVTSTADEVSLVWRPVINQNKQCRQLWFLNRYLHCPVVDKHIWKKVRQYRHPYGLESSCHYSNFKGTTKLSMPLDFAVFWVH